MLLLLLFGFVFGALSSELVLDPSIIQAVNSDPHSTWTAGSNPVFVGKRISEIRPWLHQQDLPSVDVPLTTLTTSKSPLDPNFDTYKNWPQCKRPIQNQGECGAAWTFAAAEVMSDRFCVAGKPVDLSPQALISCDSHCYGCEGCYTMEDWKYLETDGLTTEKCFPYNSSTGWVPRCPNKCVDGSPWKTYKVKAGSEVHFGSVEAAMEGLFHHGSFMVVFTVYQDFFSYKSGVYEHKSGGVVGALIAKVQGWGVDHGVKYWNVANIWGKEWGMDGYFWIRRGTDECGIEDNMWAALPWLPAGIGDDQ